MIMEKKEKRDKSGGFTISVIKISSTIITLSSFSYFVLKLSINLSVISFSVFLSSHPSIHTFSVVTIES